MNRTGRNSSHSAGMLAVLAIALAAALALGGTALAGGGHQAVRTNGPISIGGQVYPAGVLELERTASSRQLWAVMIDGRRVALAFRDHSAGVSGFALYRDEAGLLHLRGAQVASVAGGASEYAYRQSGQATLHAAAASWPRNLD